MGGDSFYDLAVLEFIDVPGNEVAPLEFRSEDIHVGDKVFAIGNPLGEYPYTVTDGIISAKNRVRDGSTGKFGFLQTTATIIWGNSGGPLVDSNNKVAGINSQIAFANAPNGEQVIQSQINFALEAKIAQRLIDDIINNDGRVKRAFLGIEVAQRYKFLKYRNKVYDVIKMDDEPVITGILPGSNASRVLSSKEGYVLTKVNGRQVRNVEEVLGEFEKLVPDSSVVLSLKNKNKTEEVTIPTGSLKTKELAMIGKYVLGQNKDLIVNYKSQYVSFSLKQDKFYYRRNNSFYRNSEAYKTNLPVYYILAAGLYSENYQNMWMVKEYRDLGAAFKLSGLDGVIDFYVLRDGDSYENIKLMRQYLSGTEKILKKTLWY